MITAILENYFLKNILFEYIFVFKTEFETFEFC